MKQPFTFLVVSSLALSANPVLAQVAGSTRLGVSTEEMRTVALGWSAEKAILDQSVYNEQNDKIGEVEDLIIAPDTTVSYLIIETGGFLGMGKHNVAIPVSQIQKTGDKLILPGATKETLKALPEFDYAK